MKRFRKTLRKWYYLRNIRQNDVLLASFPKSGNTWVAFLIANLQKDAYGLREEVNFFTIQQFIPETTEPWGRIPDKPSGQIRVIKTHDACDSSFRRVIWLVRDPRKVMRSYFLYLKGMGIVGKDLDFPAFVRLPEFGIGKWLEHSESYARRARHHRGVRMFRYEDFIADPVGQVGSVVRLLGLKDKGLDLESIVRRCDREAMLRLEKDTRHSGMREDGPSRYDFVGTERNFPNDPATDEWVMNKCGALLRQLGYVP